ncbi:MAG: hypothetical protein ACLTR6_11470, partial [Clostridium fessum]
MEAKTPCTDILVYIGNPAANPYANTSPLQTAPFYEGNEVGETSSESIWSKVGFMPNKRNEIRRFKIKIAFFTYLRDIKYWGFTNRQNMGTDRRYSIDA